MYMYYPCILFWGGVGVSLEHAWYFVFCYMLFCNIVFSLFQMIIYIWYANLTLTPNTSLCLALSHSIIISIPSVVSKDTNLSPTRKHSFYWTNTALPDTTNTYFVKLWNVSAHMCNGLWLTLIFWYRTATLHHASFLLSPVLPLLSEDHGKRYCRQQIPAFLERTTDRPTINKRFKIFAWTRCEIGN